MKAREARALALEWIASNADYLAESFTGEIEELSVREAFKVSGQVLQIGKELARRAAKLQENCTERAPLGEGPPQ